MPNLHHQHLYHKRKQVHTAPHTSVQSPQCSLHWRQPTAVSHVTFCNLL